MIGNFRIGIKAGLAAGLISCLGGIAAAQGAPTGGAAGGAAAASSMNRNIAKDTSPLNPENSLELIKPADRQEESAYKEFKAVSPEDPAKKIQLGEAFLQRYQVSQYRSLVYSGLTSAYLQTNQIQKMEEAGDKDIVLNPRDVQVLAMLGQTIPRVITSTTQDQDKRLEKAEQYSNRAIEVMASITKPAGMTDEQFTQAKNQTLAIAHSGLGLVNFRRGNYAAAITELEECVKLDPRGDATNYYVLGVAHQNSKHFADAAEAFNKCAEFHSGLLATCRDNAEKAAKLVAPPSTP